MAGPSIIAGTDTEIGKTVFSAGLADALGASYWKPVQSGLEEPSDTETVARLGAVPAERQLPEAYRFQLPASPHISARAEGATIDRNQLKVPAANGPLLIELAGGLLVPLTDDLLTIDQVKTWCEADPSLRLVLCARTQLGTINHSLLSLEALAARKIPVLGIAFIGPPEPEAEASVIGFSGVKRLGRLEPIANLSHGTLRAAFAKSFDVADFQ